jgi:hypothetical protein
MTLTKKQKKAVSRAFKRWKQIHMPFPMLLGGGAIVLPVGGTESNPHMYLAIEPNGHTHS